MAVAKVGDIILLEGDIEYKVEECIELEDQSFLIVKKVNYTLESILKNQEQKVKVLEEFVDENDDYYLKIVDDLTLLNKIKKIALS